MTWLSALPWNQSKVYCVQRIVLKILHKQLHGSLKSHFKFTLEIFPLEVIRSPGFLLSNLYSLAVFTSCLMDLTDEPGIIPNKLQKHLYISAKCSYEDSNIQNEVLENLRNECNHKSIWKSCVLSIIKSVGNGFCFSIGYRAPDLRVSIYLFLLELVRGLQDSQNLMLDISFCNFFLLESLEITQSFI